MRKTSGKVFLGHRGGHVFHFFPRLQSIISGGGAPQMAFRYFVDHVTILNSSPI